MGLLGSGKATKVLILRLNLTALKTTHIMKPLPLQPLVMSLTQSHRCSQLSTTVKLFNANRVEQLSAIIHDTPIDVFNQIDSDDDSRRTADLVSLVNGYRGKLHAALEVYDRRDESNTAIARRVREVGTHLAHVVAHYAGDI